jgi:hypothetical protein
MAKELFHTTINRVLLENKKKREKKKDKNVKGVVDVSNEPEPIAVDPKQDETTVQESVSIAHHMRKRNARFAVVHPKTGKVHFFSNSRTMQQALARWEVQHVGEETLDEVKVLRGVKNHIMKKNH